jgi:hypothetical protein
MPATARNVFQLSTHHRAVKLAVGISLRRPCGSFLLPVWPHCRGCAFERTPVAFCYAGKPVPALTCVKCARDAPASRRAGATGGRASRISLAPGSRFPAAIGGRSAASVLGLIDLLIDPRLRVSILNFGAWPTPCLISSACVCYIGLTVDMRTMNQRVFEEGDRPQGAGHRGSVEAL